MPNDNLYGAPAEGLGQNVTFAFNTPRGAPVLPAAQATLSSARIIGGDIGSQTKGTGVAPARPNAVLETIVKLSDGVAATQIRKKQTELFFTGMQRAAHGEAVKDIAQEQPWYSKLFGDSDVVEGARAYTGHTLAQTTISAMEDDMPNIRSMTQPEANQYFIKQIEAAQTGDMATDIAVMQSFTRSMPALMRRQAKEHYGWQQERAVAAQTGSFRASADRLQAAGAGLAKDPSSESAQRDYQETTDLFLQSIAPVQNQDPKGYTEMVADNMVALANDGKLHAVTALQKKGVADILTADQHSRVTKAIAAGETKLRTKYSFDYSDDIAVIKALSAKPAEGETTNQLKARIDALNTQYRVTTGSTQALIQPEERAALLSHSLVEVARAQDRLTDAAIRDAAKMSAAGQKLEAQEAKVAAVQQAVSQGNLVGVFGVPKTERDDIAYTMYRNAPTVQDKVKLLALNTGYVIEPVKEALNSTIEGALSTEAWTPEVAQVYDGYVQLRNTNRFVADNYYSKYQKQLEGLYQAQQNGVPMEGAFRSMFLGPARRAAVGKKDAEDSIKAIVSEHSGLIGQVFGGDIPLKPGQANRIFNVLAPQIEEWSGYMNGNYKEAAIRAYQTAKQSQGLEVLGGYTWENSKGQESMFTYLTRTAKDASGKPIPTDNVGKLIESAINSRHKAVTNESDSGWFTSVFRLPDIGGAPVLHVNSYKDGKNVNYTVSIKDIQEQAKHLEVPVDYTPAAQKKQQMTGAPQVLDPTPEQMRERFKRK